MSRFGPQGFTTIPRTSIESSRHSSIDASLKDLKTVSRRVTAFSTPYHTELQLLERIYYKGKNQHRSALFWRKVLEIRRFTIRINEINLSGFVEDTHYAFHGTEDRSNSKVPRGSWKLVLDSSSCMSLLIRLRSLCLLVDQTRTRFRVAHETFTQQMQTASFIPLVMSLISITSRLDFLLSELREILALFWQAVTRILDVIEPDINKSHNIFLPSDPFGFSEAMVSRVTRTKRVHKREAATTGFTEDFGSIIPREPYPARATTGSHTPKASSGAIGQTLVAEAELSVAHQDPSGFTGTPSPPHPVSSVSIPTLPNMSCQFKNDTDVSFHIKTIPPSELLLIRRSAERRDFEQGIAGTKRKAKAAKMKKNTDEIDDIFGF